MKKIKQNEITRFSFKINFAAFQNVEKGGRQAALIWLSPSLTFYFLGLLIWLLRFLFSIRIFSHLSALATSIIALAMFFLGMQNVINIVSGDKDGLANSTFSAANIIWIVVGAAWWIVVIYGYVQIVTAGGQG